ncbi:cytochrome P450 2K1-like [Colossoma macropomum]|uniref:cytochrome P450 2K1-like n=1 Tax=Colossoma macropomum TaxID=42526 RepID=UPI0018650ABC|nr:cytochrome P450 2K1-like [Colossoma macropomum]
MALVEGLLLQATSTGILLGFVILLVVVYFLFSGSSFKEAANEPPGPKPLPLLGNLLQLDLDRPHESLCELAKTYGSVFKVYFGPKKVVVLAGYKTVKQALVNYAEEFGEREIARTFKNFSEEHGILFSNGENWKEMRRFALTNLRDFGMGKRGSEEKIIEEIHYLKEVFESFGGEPFDTTQPVNYAVSNIISSIVYGSRFEYSDPCFKQMVNRANENVRIGGSAPIRLYNVFPWIGPFLRSKRTLETNAENNKKQINELVSALKETLNPDDRRGFVDSFLLRKQSDEQSGQKNSRFNEKNLFTTVINLFVAGTDTTGTTLRWGLLLMAKYPHIQDRVHEEIDRVIGGRQAVVEDRKNLPYTDAVIHEIQRLANIVPMSLPHTTSCDVNFNGFFIKKGTTVYPLLTSVLRDENEWERPHTFNPAHFLDEKGRFVKKDAFLPFSAGRRVCLGESLARMELFLFFTSLLQHFRFTPPPGMSEDQLDLTAVVGITLNPSPHKLCAVKRS